MKMRFQSGALAAIAFGALLAGTGCSPVREHQGYVMDTQLANGIQPGVDNRESVTRTLGRPTFVGQFDDRDWYYVSRLTRQLAYQMPRANEQTVLRIRFDQAGNVERVERTGLELTAAVDPWDRETPTLGRKRSLFEEIFGNIGAAARGQPGQTADNPQ